MIKRILIAVIACCFVFQSGMAVMLVMAEEDSSETEEAEPEYINGFPVDYDDPDCLKYIKLQETDTMEDASVPQTFSNGITTSWGGVTYSHKTSMAEGKTITPGIDVSKWEGNIDWNKVANSGIEFAFIRIGNTGASTGKQNLDPYYHQNMKNAISAGIKVGVYYYSQALTVAEAEKEAQYVLDNLGNYNLDLPIIIDYEYYYDNSGNPGRLTSTTPNKSTKTSIVKAFCKKIEANGYRAGLYADKDMLTNSLNASEIDSDYEVWMAQWRTSESDYTGSYQYWQCGGASVSGISGKTDLDWGYFSDSTGMTTTSSAKSTGTDIVKKSNGEWVYQVNGQDDYTYTGFAQNSNGWWYVEKGKVTFNKNDVIKGTVNGTNAWWYVVGSKVQTSFTGLADYKNEYGWWYIKNGKVDFSVNTVAKNKNGWYYVKDSKVIFSYNGFAQNEYGWWYIENGKVTFKDNSVIKDKNKKIDGTDGWWYVDGSKVQSGYTGVANYKNSNGWWYVKKGKVDFSANTVAKNKNGWWYVLGGKVQFGYTGLADYKNEYGWWYIKSGKVDFSYKGIASNKNGSWYVSDGKVDFSYSGTVENSGIVYIINNGKVIK